jgi:alkylation response protein AidB-like acyl-CoA dehydrogenase
MIMRDGAPHMVDGFPLMRASMLPIERCTILDTWAVSGMRATGSNDVAFEDVFVPEAFTFAWPDTTSSWQRGAFGTVPLPTQLGVALTAVALGVARHALDVLLEIAVTKVPAGTRASLRERPLAQLQIAQAEGLVQAARAYLYQAYDDVWQRGESETPFDVPARAAARLASVTATKLAAQAVDLVHDAAGMNAVQTTCDLQRCWRDIHTITQHVILGTARYEVVGRVLFGLDPGSPII